MLALRHGGEKRQGGGGGLKCDLLNSLGGRGEFGFLTSLFHLELVFKLLMPVERQNAEAVSNRKRKRVKERRGVSGRVLFPHLFKECV